MPRRGENIYKRKDGRWEGRYLKGYGTGQKKRYGYIYGKTYRETKEKLFAAREAQAEKESGKENTDKTTFTCIAGEWMESVRPFLKESTMAKYRNCLNTHIIPKFGACRMSEIGNPEVEQFRNELLTKGGKKKCGLSPKYAADILSLVKVIQKYAAQKPGISCTVHSVSVKRKPGQMHILSENEQARLFQYLMGSCCEADLGILISMFTGLRIGEVCALKWEDIDLEERTISVRHTLQRIQVEDGTKKTKVHITTPKSSSSQRNIPIPSVIFEKLKNAAKPGAAFVLTGEAGHFTEPRTMQNHFKTIAENCQIEQATFHTLRHTFATRCVSIGFDVKTLSEILGHADVTTTLNRYVHPTMSQKRRNMDKLSTVFAVR